jgi:tetratricopeptide (TPR) repeat protein
MAGTSDGTGHDNTRSAVSGDAGDVVQARDVSGGIHFHYGRGAQEAPPRLLPRGVRVFVNRADDLARLDELLADPHLKDGPGIVHLITGTAGVGKTSLALHWAHKVSEHFHNGQLYIDLHGYDPGSPMAPEQALERFLLALGVPGGAIPQDAAARSDLYRSVLAGRKMLVILDNAARTDQVRPLIPGSGGNLTIVTSRSHLSGLAIREGAQRTRLTTLGESEAIELLVATTAGYRSGDNAEELAELATLCANLPLALRIAAERSASRPGMPLSDLIGELRNETELWAALSTDEEDEANAVRTVFAWSYRALPADAAKLFCLLGLHPGGEASEDAVVALSGMEHVQVRRSLEILVGTCLVESQTYARYKFHDLLRAYAVDRARYEISQEEQLAVVERACDWYLRMAYSGASQIAHDVTLLFSLDTGPDAIFTDRDQAATWYLAERPNLVGAVSAAADTGNFLLAWRLAAVLERLYATYNHFSDWRTTALVGLAAARALGEPDKQAVIYESLGRLSRLTMRLDEADQYYRQAITIHTELADTLSVVKDLNGLAWVHLFGHRLDDARADLLDAQPLVQRLGDQYWIATIRCNLGYVNLQLGNWDEAEQNLSGSLEEFRALGDRLYESMTLTFLSLLARWRGDTAAALTDARQAVDLSVEESNPLWEATALIYLGKAQIGVGDAEAALTSFHRATVICRQDGDVSREARALDGAGRAYSDLGRADDAADFFRRAAAVHRQLGDRWKLAMTLGRLADVTDEPGLRRQYRGEAASILEEFGDDRSVTARRHLLAALAGED